MLALFARAKPRKWFLPFNQSDNEDADQYQPHRPRRLDEAPMPLSAAEAPFYADMPLDQRGAPQVRSQLSDFIAERGSIEAGRMQMFSFDDDINALHFIARYERAGVGHLAEGHRRLLEQHRALEAARGKPFARINQYTARDYDSEERMQRMYGSPEQDRARIIQFYRRLAERDHAGRLGLPGRYSSYEAV